MSSKKKLLSKYAKEYGLSNTKYFVDDGYTGTNFNRPGFNDMIRAIEAGYISAVIVKDLSRLGRDYLKVGYYTDNFSPEHNVRFIAVNDGVDSAEGDDDFTPFRNIMNEWYARDISRKIRSSQRLRGSAGVPLSLPPHGYMKDPDNPKHWVVDEEAAMIVRRIYQLCIDCFGVEKTAAILEQDKVLKPTEYWKSKGVRKPGKKSFKDIPYYCCKITVQKILTLREYMGDVVNIKTYPSRSRTNSGMRTRKKTMLFSRPSMSRSLTDRHGKHCSTSGRGQNGGSPSRRSEIFFQDFSTAPIAAASSTSTSIIHTRSYTFNCSNYRGNRGTCDSTHYIQADAARCRELDELFTKTYEDNTSGKLSGERFMIITKRYDDEKLALKKKISALQTEIDAEEKSKHSAASFLQAVRKYTEIDELTPKFAPELVEKIVVHQAQGTGKNKTQQLEIYYNFVGVLDMPEVAALPQSVTVDTRQGVAVEYITRKAR